MLSRRVFLSAVAAMQVLTPYVRRAQAKPRLIQKPFGGVDKTIYFADNAPYRYVPQPQIGDMHECDMPEVVFITGDRASGKSWAAAAQCCEHLTKIPGAKIAAVGHSLEFANLHMRPILELMLGDRIDGEDSTCIVLKNGSTIHFFGEGSEGRMSRFRLAWIDSVRDVWAAAMSLRSAAHSLVITCEERPSWMLFNADYILRRSRLREWLATQPVPPRRFAESYRRIVDGSVDRCEAAVRYCYAQQEGQA